VSDGTLAYGRRTLASRADRARNALAAASATPGAGRVDVTLTLSPTTVRQIALALLAVDIALVLTFFFLTSLGYELRAFGLDTESSIPTWYASAKLLVLAQVMIMTAVVLARRCRADGLLLLLLGLLVLGLSADEVAMIHEHLGPKLDRVLTGATERGELTFARTGYWMLVLGPLLAGALAVGLWLVGQRIRPGRAVARLGVGGVALFLTSALGFEMLSNFTYGNLGSVLQITLEEGGEMIGTTLVLWAALLLLASLLGRRAGAEPPAGGA
jgi:hypothetical protein